MNTTQANYSLFTCGNNKGEKLRNGLPLRILFWIIFRIIFWVVFLCLHETNDFICSERNYHNNYLEENKNSVISLIKESVSDQELSNEYYFVHLTSDPHDDYGFIINIPITEEMLQVICRRFDYFNTKTQFMDPNNIDHVMYDNENKKIIHIFAEWR